MAKYDIKFSCGHTGTIELFGKTSERESKISYFENHGLCAECRKAEKASLTDTLEQELELPEIEGVSDKQIAYARSLRFTAVNSHKEQIKTIKKQFAEDDNITIEQIKEAANKKPSSLIVTFYFGCFETNASAIINALK